MLVGCCGWPEARSRYFEHFDAVELQDTFYDPPPAGRAAKWRAAAPPEFRFCLKAWQLITHEPSSPTYRRLKAPVAAGRRDRFGAFRPTDEVFQAWAKTREIADAVAAAVIVFQCPASFRPTVENVRNLENFFGAIERGAFTFAWEPRGEWPRELVGDLCRRLALLHCVDPLAGEPVTSGDLAYFRLHGRGGYRYRYSDEELEEIRRRTGRSANAYVMFNNTYMKDDALRFRALLEGSS